METATNAREFHVARRHQRRIDRRGQHRLPSEVKVWCLDLGDDFRCRLSGDNLGRAVIADVRSWKLVDIPQTFLAIEGTPREREDRISDIHGVRINTIADAKHLQGFEERLSRGAGIRHEAVEHTRHVLIEQRIEEIDCLGCHQLTVFLDGMQAMRPGIGEGKMCYWLNVKKRDRTAKWLANLGANIVSKELHELGLVWPRQVVDLGLVLGIMQRVIHDFGWNEGDNE